MSVIGEAVEEVGDTVGDVVESVGGVINDAIVEPIIQEVLQPIAKTVESTIQAALDDPVAAAATIATAVYAPYLLPLTNATIAVSNGASIEDAAKVAAITWATTAGLEAAGVNDYTKGVGEDAAIQAEVLRGYTPQQAAILSKTLTSSLNSGIVGGTRALLTGKNIQDGISNGLVSGASYGSTGEFFNQLQKDGDLDINPKYVDAIGKSAGAGLSAIATGKDPAAAVGNYLAYTLMTGGSSLKSQEAASKAYNNMRDTADVAQKSYAALEEAQDAFNTKVDAYQKEVDQYNSDIKSSNELLNKWDTTIQPTLDSLKKTYDDNVFAYNADKVIYDNTANSIADRNAAASRMSTSALNANNAAIDWQSNFDKNKELNDQILSSQSKLDLTRKSIEETVAKLNDPTSLEAKPLADATSVYTKANEAYNTAKTDLQTADEALTKQITEATTRNITIDSINQGIVKPVSTDANGNVTFDNGMVLSSDGKVSQNGQTLFSTADGVNQKELQFSDANGNEFRYGNTANRLLSTTDVQGIMKDKYGLDVDPSVAQKLAGQDFTKYDDTKFQDLSNVATKDAQQEQTRQQNINTQVTNILKQNGYSNPDIRSLKNDGTFQQYLDTIDSAYKTNAYNLQQKALDAAFTYGEDSNEYKEANAKALDAMSTTGGFGVVKQDDGTFKSTYTGALDATGQGTYNTLVDLFQKSTQDTSYSNLRDQIMKSDATEEEKQYLLSNLNSYQEAQALPKTGTVSDTGVGAVGKLYSPFAANDPRIAPILAKNPNIAKAYSEYANTYGFANEAANAGYLKNLVEAYKEAVPSQKEALKGEILKIEQSTPSLITPEIKALIGTELSPVEQGTVVSPPPVTEVDLFKEEADKIAELSDKGFVTPEEALSMMKELGYTGTAREASYFTGMYPEDAIMPDLNTYVDRNLVTTEEARQALIDAGVQNPTVEDINKLIGQYEETGLTGKATANAPMAQVNANLANFNEKYDTLTAEQKKLADDLIAQGVDVSKAIDSVKLGLGQQINTLSGVVKEQYDALTATQKAEVDARVQQGSDLQKSIAEVQSGLSSDITGVKTDVSNLSDTVKSNYDSLTVGQKKIADDLIAQGVDVSKAIDDVKSGLGQQITDVKTDVSTLSDTVKANYDSLTSGQKQIADDLIAQGKTSAEAVAEAKATLTTDIAGVKTDVSDLSSTVKANYEALTSGQKQIADDLIAQGKTSAEAIAEAKSTLSSDISGVKTDVSDVKTDVSNLSDTVKSNYDALSAEQKKLADNLIQQGVDVSKAISDVQSGLGQQITDVKTDLGTQISTGQTATQAALETLTDAQKAEVANRVQMGEDINAAINDVRKGLGTQITDTQTALEKRIADQALIDAAANQKILDQMAADKAAAEEKALADAKAAADAKAIADAKAVADAKAAADKLEADKIAAQKVNLGKSAQSILSGSSGSGSSGSGVAGALATAASMAPTFLTSKVTQDKFQDPLANLRRLQSEPFSNENTNQPAQQPENPNTMSDPFYNYGQNQSIDDILGLSTNTGVYAKEGGLMSTPLMATGGMTGTRYGQYATGGLSANVIPHSGKMRVDFRSGDAVTGEGDGQSDDIPAMLADGEFVFPADVVAAIGNGSTKAGSDKLYDMMHGIRSHVRSAKPQDLPPEIKSPLDFLKTKRKKARS